MNESSSDAVNSLNQRIFETSLDLILVTDRRGNFLRVSPSSAAILGYEPEELIGHNAVEFLYPDDLDNTRSEMRLARRGQLTRNFETRYVHNDGHVVTLAWTGVWSEPDQQHFFIGRDMTERIAAEERLRRSQQLEAVGQLTGGIAHDFNNMLGTVIANLDVLSEKIKDRPEATEIANDALAGALRGAELVKRLLAFARKQPLQPRTLALKDTTSDVVPLLKRTLGENIEITVRTDDGLWLIRADPVQLENAILNLAINARDAMPEGGQLLIEAANFVLEPHFLPVYPDLQAGDYVVISVTDTGSGMSPEVLARVFEPFFTTKGVGTGTGLGLSMVYGTMKQSGGGVKIYSEPGKGTTVRLFLPRVLSDTEAETTSVVDAAPVPTGTERILVVEDNADVRKVTARILATLGYQFKQVENADTALELLRRDGKFDLLFTDVVMPGSMSGLALARRVHELHPCMPIVLTSGFSSKIGSDQEIRALGAALIVKPYRKAELANVLRAALDRIAPRR